MSLSVKALSKRYPHKKDISDQQIQQLIRQQYDGIIVLDDDPTGCQTVHDIPILLPDKDLIQAEIKDQTPCFFILTNSRSLSVDEAYQLYHDLAAHIHQLEQQYDKRFLLVSRSDSTLRGHFKAESTALINGLHYDNPLLAFVPAFMEGNRYTVDRIHYVVTDDQWIPASETPYAQDKTFAFKHSDLYDYVIDKMGHQMKVSHLPLSLIRGDTARDPDYLADSTLEVFLADAVDYRDLRCIAYEILSFQRPILVRSAASLVSALAGRYPKLVLPTISDLSTGGLIIVGSHVPITSKQLSFLQSNHDIEMIEFSLSRLIQQDTKALCHEYTSKITKQITDGNHVVLFTTRKQMDHPSLSALDFGQLISDSLTKIVEDLSIAPTFMICKGGITSNVIAIRALNMKRGIVLGQIEPGVPLWSLGELSRFPEMPFVVFPGNVGSEHALHDIVKKFELQLSRSK